jgi:acetyl-CoA/propionyl-CoA carboxylase biotin carboxyl carrier protein
MKFALDETVILGIGTNQSYLRSIADHPQVREGRVDTGFLGKEFSNFYPTPADNDLDLLVAAYQSGLGKLSGGFHSHDEEKRFPSPWSTFSRD